MLLSAILFFTLSWQACQIKRRFFKKCFNISTLLSDFFEEKVWGDYFKVSFNEYILGTGKCICWKNSKNYILET